MGSGKSLKFKFRELNRKRINGTRSLLLNLVIFLFDSGKNQVSTSEDAPILVLRSDGKIGDSIVGSGFFRELKKHSPQSKIIVIGNPQVLSVYKNSKHIDEILILKKGLSSTIKMFLKVRKMNFRFFVNSTDELKPHAAFIQGQIKAGKKFIFGHHKLKSTTHPIIYKEGQTHFSCLYENTLAEMFPNEDIDVSYELNIDSTIVDRVGKLLEKRIGRNKRVITFNAFAGTKLRSFSCETTLKIVDFLLRDPNNVVLSIGTPKDIQTILSWKKKLPSERWIVLEELKTLEEGLAQIYHSDLLVSPDTSLVHAACALNKKVVAVYRQRGMYQNSSQWGPRMRDSSNFRVVHALSNDIKYWDVNLLKISDLEEAVNGLINSEETTKVMEYV